MTCGGVKATEPCNPFATGWGRQVLNMRPAETLGMLEEAAGTRMYEDKKEKAKATIAKKQIKVDEINKVPRPRCARRTALCL